MTRRTWGAAGMRPLHGRADTVRTPGVCRAVLPSRHDPPTVV